MQALKEDAWVAAMILLVKHKLALMQPKRSLRKDPKTRQSKTGPFCYTFVANKSMQSQRWVERREKNFEAEQAP